MSDTKCCPLLAMGAVANPECSIRDMAKDIFACRREACALWVPHTDWVPVDDQEAARAVPVPYRVGFIEGKGYCLPQDSTTSGRCGLIHYDDE